MRFRFLSQSLRYAFPVMGSIFIRSVYGEVAGVVNFLMEDGKGAFLVLEKCQGNRGHEIALNVPKWPLMAMG